MGEGWFCEIGGREIGPLLPQQLRAMAAEGQILPTDRIRRGNAGNWVPASQVHGLFPSPEESSSSKPQNVKQAGNVKPSDKDKESRAAKQSKEALLEKNAYDELELAELSLLSSLPLHQAPGAKKPSASEPSETDSSESEEYELAPLPEEKPLKQPPVTTTPKKSASVSPTPSSKGRSDRSVDLRKNKVDNPLLDLGIEPAKKSPLLQAGAGVSVSPVYARRQRQQQQRLYVSLAVIGAGVLFALVVLMTKGCGKVDQKTDAPKKTAAGSKDSGVKDSGIIVKPATPQPLPTLPVPKPKVKDLTTQGVIEPKVKPGATKVVEKVDEEPLAPPTGTPEADFGIKPEDEVPLPPQPVPKK